MSLLNELGDIIIQSIKIWIISSIYLKINLLETSAVDSVCNKGSLWLGQDNIQ